MAFALVLTTVLFQARSASAAPTPYGGTRWAVPGTIQAENYDNGGEGMAYHDTTAGNTGGAYRADGVDLEGSTEGGYNIGWAVAGEWLNYSINVPTAGTYDIQVRVASNGGGGTFHFNLDQTNISGAMSVPNTGGWQNWQTVTKTGVYFAAGDHLLGLGMDGNGATGGIGNFNWIQITGGGGPTGPVCFYADINYTGSSFCSGAGSFGSVPSGWNDRVSSVKVQSGYTAELFADGNLSGTRLALTGDQSWLGNNNFNDLMSSYRITQGTTGGCNTFREVFTETMFNQSFPSRNGFYTYQGLVDAAAFYPAFGGTGDCAMKRREVAAAMANFHHETGGLYYVTEINKSNDLCDESQWYGCPAGTYGYYGRGPIQLSWNFNYKAAGDALGLNLLNNPYLVEQDPAVAWKTALWFWMTQTGAGSMTAHNAIINNNGFGETIRTINGSLECGGRNPAQVQSRVDQYNRILGIVGSSAVGNSYC
jgi:predicted chitinase